LASFVTFTRVGADVLARCPIESTAEAHQHKRVQDVLAKRYPYPSYICTLTHL
jgi:hypothetical protein